MLVSRSSSTPGFSFTDCRLLYVFGASVALGVIGEGMIIFHVPFSSSETSPPSTATARRL